MRASAIDRCPLQARDVGNEGFGYDRFRKRTRPRPPISRAAKDAGSGDGCLFPGTCAGTLLLNALGFCADALPTSRATAVKARSSLFMKVLQAILQHEKQRCLSAGLARLLPKCKMNSFCLELPYLRQQKRTLTRRLHLIAAKFSGLDWQRTC